MDLDVGDIVIYKPSSLVMTVESLSPITAITIWFDADGILQKGAFPINELEKTNFGDFGIDFKKSFRRLDRVLEIIVETL